MERAGASLRQLVSRVQELELGTERGAAAVDHLESNTAVSTRCVVSIGEAVGACHQEVEDMTRGVVKIASGVAGLGDSLRTTATAVSKMEASIAQIERHAAATARISASVSDDAQLGVAAVRATLGGIDRIRSTSVNAVEEIERLGARILDIGRVMDVIDEVGDQTNLLALNAAIIAAQAGDSGTGFAVVAAEIGTLADRTASSAREVFALIKEIQAQSLRAVVAITSTRDSADQGARLGKEAAQVFDTISSSSAQCTQMVGHIARATIEQARESSQISQSVQEFSRVLGEVDAVCTSQTSQARSVQGSTHAMQALARQLHSASQAQTDAAGYLGPAISRIETLVAELREAQGKQAGSAEHIHHAVAHVRRVVEGQTRSVRDLGDALRVLDEQGGLLESALRQLRL